MPNTDWYAETAYDSRKKKDVPPPDASAWKGKERALRAHPLPIGVHCADYRAYLEKTTLQELKKGLPKGKLNHEYSELYTLANPKVAVATLRWLGGVISIVGLFTTIMTLNTGELSAYDWRNYIWFLLPFSIFILCCVLMKYIPDKNNTIFNRRTGLVTIPRGGKKTPVILPFAELDGYYYCSHSTVNVNYLLHFGHRFTPRGYGTGRSWVDRYWIYVEWEFLQQYMDISLPLPDIPDLEPYRHLDSTTAAYDKQYSREPHYWRDMDMAQFEKERQEGIQAIENFPWEELPVDHIPQELMKKLFPGVRLFS
jgi:hypothetical protein